MPGMLAAEPAGCDQNTDVDCSPNCDDGELDPGESCDPISTCPTECDDGVACSLDVLTGSAANCSATCAHNIITSCRDDDGCCAAGCDHTVDNDCSPSCRNGNLDPGETCDPPASCPTSCDDGDACTIDSLTGDAASCSAECVHLAVTECSDDGCCVPSCSDDPDCDEAPPADDTATGCGCKGSDAGSAVLFVGLVLLVRRRRRTCP